ncbi:glutathione S-transferase [Shimia sp. R11_0]|uniref:glutathione S-transferase n=1 Tax=Shimia sp. R11_0 TaxID=2821096 RepID=UPI001ADC53CE|nr:glutathione S-transferase [Shimia sp. R11_0]MBO9478309.1 glutathione S-transferase [Shimia sp. R11_0]
MTYDLYLGDYAYSSWSLRGWLLFEKFGISRSTTMVDFADSSVGAQLAKIAPARTVPAVRTPEGALLSDSLAIAEELASRHPDAGLWPQPPIARATARNLAAEMHSGFMALRSECPMNLRLSYVDTAPSDAVKQDLQRLEVIWEHARGVTDAQEHGPWLCGPYSVADAFYAPVAARIAGYNLPVGPTAQTYVQAHLADPAFRRWRAMGMVHGATLPWYAKDFQTQDWPGPKSHAAKAVDSGTPENTLCPYSGTPVTHLMEIDGRIFGMCNAFCRDKTVADPEAWPAFMALL